MVWKVTFPLLVRRTENGRWGRLPITLVLPERGIALLIIGPLVAAHRLTMSTRICDVNYLWKWASSLSDAQTENLLAAIGANRSFARATAWAYLYDEELGSDLIDKALESVQRYAAKSTPVPSPAKLTLRLRSQIRRVAKQSRNAIKETHKGSLRDLELLATTESPNLVEQLYLEEIVKLMSPTAARIASYLRLGYTWREIGEEMGIDSSTGCKAFRRETDAILTRLGVANRLAR